MRLRQLFTKITNLLRSSNRTTQTTVILIVILLIAAGLRLLLWSQPLHEPANDENEYIAVAYDLLEGRGWTFYEHYHWLRAPLYPLFLAASLWLTNGDLHLAALPNIVLSTATVGLIFLFTRLLIPPSERKIVGEGVVEDTGEDVGERAPLLAAAMGAFLFTFNTFASLYMSETLFTFLLTASFTLLLWWKRTHHPFSPAPRTPRKRGFWILVVAGVLYGLATLTRSVSLAFLPFVVGWIAWDSDFVRRWRAIWRERTTYIRLGQGILFALMVVLTIAPWTIRNCIAYGRCIPVETGLSYNLWAFSEPKVSRNTIFRTLESIPNPAERADIATQRGLARLQEDPAILLRKLYPNWTMIWRIKPIQDRFLLPNYYTDPPPLVFLGALLLDDLLYVVILIAAVGGVVWRLIRPSPSRAEWRLMALPLLWMGYIIATTILTHGEGRYRHFFFTFLIAFAAIGLTTLLHNRRPFCFRPITVPPLWMRGIAMGSGVLFLAMALSPLLRYYPWEWAIGGAQRSAYRIVADSAAAMGNLSLAEASYQRAYQAQKTADGRLLLGNLYLQMGDIERAEEAFESGWERRRRYVAATALLGDVIRQQGYEEEAREAFEGYFVAEQAVTDWSWEHLSPPPTSFIDVGNGLDFGYVGGVYNAEEVQGATARWTDGHGLLSFGHHSRRWRYASDSVPMTTTYLLRMRLAAPRPNQDSQHAQDVVAAVCYGYASQHHERHNDLPYDQHSCHHVPLAPTWRIVSLVIPPSSRGNITRHRIEK